MASERHSYVRFFPSDWRSGTAHMTWLQRSVYFDICCYEWQFGTPCPAAELPLMLGDIPDWREVIDDLVASKVLRRLPDGAVLGRGVGRRPRPAGSVWRRLRAAVFERDNHRCVYCGSSEKLECDHVLARSLGGTDDEENLVTACKECNRAKGALPIEQWRSVL